MSNIIVDSLSGTITTCVVNGVSSATTGTNLYLSSGGVGYSNWSNDISDDHNITDFMELTLMALGYDIKFDEFKNMSKEERKSIIRDIKINRIIK